LQSNVDLTGGLVERVRAAFSTGEPLRLEGAGSKSFLGRDTSDAGHQTLAVSGHAGIIDYQPEELVVTARCGTTLEAIDVVLSEHGQQLSFEPPWLGPGATIGGTIACGLSGPARPYAGSARDLVLGARVLTGRGEVLRFGGEVMKNVAGYDCSRLMTSALGTLGVLLDLSLKVMPIPAMTLTRTQACDQAEAIARMTRWVGRPLPVTATFWDGEQLWVRLSGAEQGVRAAVSFIGGDAVDEVRAERFWREKVREQGHGFFAGDQPLWRLSVPPATPPLDLPGRQVVEWGGGQRWLKGDLDVHLIRDAATRVGGHATLFRGGDRAGEVFHPLPAPLMALHRSLKAAFDPKGILNPGRLYPGL